MYYPPVSQPNHKNYQRITVRGNGVLSIEPEVAEITFGVVTEEEELQAAQQQNAAIIEQVIQALLGLGVAQESIQTVDYTAQPLYEYTDGQQIFSGYQVTHMLTVTVENITSTGSLIDTAVQHGVNRVTTIAFTIENKTVYYQQALKLALEDATTKAKTIATAMRLNLNHTPASIVEQTNVPPPLPYQTLTASEAAGGLSTPIKPGRLDIKADVEVVFSYLS